jgi:hypothetical protein
LSTCIQSPISHGTSQMKSQEYKTALFQYFNVTSLKELRANQQWQEVAAREDITNLRTVQSLEKAYQAVFGCTQDSSNADDITDSTSKEEDTTSRIVDLVEDKSTDSKFDSNSEETGCFHVMEDNQGNMVGALLEYSSEQSQKLIQHFKNLELHSPQPWHQGSLHSAVVDQLGATSALVATGLQAGQLFRVVGPPDLVAKVASGAYQMMQTSTGALGTVTNGAGKIAGQLRFASGSSALPVLAPIAVYQVLHAIVGTQQLNEINQRLAKIEHTLQELYVRQEATVLGEIHYAVTVLDDILESRMKTGIFTPDAISRLALVEKTILSILERNRLLTERFRDKASSVKKQSKRKGARNTAELLKTDGPQATYDMQCLVGLIAADLKLEQALLLLAMQNNPTDIGRRQERIRSKMESHHAVVENLPSIQELEKHAQACLKAMGWWEKLFDFGKTKGEVKVAQKLKLKDIRPSTDELQPSLNGYVFWRDADGIHAFAMSGDDLAVHENTLQLTVKSILSPGSTHKIRLPGSSEPIQIFVEKEMETGLWFGYRTDGTSQDKVLIQHKDLYKPCLIQEDV